MNSKTAIIILAAGKGTRMKSTKPKVLHEIGKLPMINHVINSAKQLNPEIIVTILSKDMEDVERSIETDSKIAIQKEQLGTADAVKEGLKQLKDFKGNIIILYADIPLITINTLYKLNNDADLTLLSFNAKDPAQYGRIITQDDHLIKIVEFADATDEEKNITLCNSAIMRVKSDLIFNLIDKISNNNAKKEFYLTDLIELAVNNNYKCNHLTVDENEVQGVNDKVQLSQAEKLFQNKMRKEIMQKGITLIDPDTTYFAHDIKFGIDIIVEPNVVFGKNVTLEDNVYIKSFSHIEGAYIGKDSIIGPYARIRPGTNIEENVKIGNFVEIKKSQINNNVKISHLSYIGDSDIDDNTNIGAGTITCNYDGYNKYKTTIGKNVFVGSNTALVAPINIGDNSIIGAGSTITKDVNNDDIAISRNSQKNLNQQAKKFHNKRQNNKK